MKGEEMEKQIKLSENLSGELAKIERVLAADTIAKLNGFMDLKISGIDDKSGYTEVHKALQYTKKQRIAVENMRQQLKRAAIDYGRAVDGAAKSIQAIIEPVETYLSEIRQSIDDEKQRIIEEQKRAEAARRAQIEIDQIWDQAHEENDRINREREEREAEAARLEAQRIEQERKEAELAAKQAEIERLEREAKIAREAADAERQRIREAEERAAKEKAKHEAAEVLRRQQAPDKLKLSMFCDELTSVIENAPTLIDARLAGLLGADLSIMVEIRDRLKKLSL